MKSLPDILLESLKIPALLVRKDDTIKSVNKSFEDFSGFSEVGAQKRRKWNIFFNDDMGADPPFMDSSSLEERECQLFDRTRAKRYVRIFLSEVPGTAERLITLIDMTSCRDAFFSMIERAPYGALILDESRRTIFINREFTRITGYGLKDVPTGKDWFLKAFPESGYRAHVIDVWKTVVSTSWVDKVLRVVCKTGEVKEIEFRASLLEDGRAIAMLSDITGRRKSEIALKESEIKFRTLFEKSADGIILCDGTLIVDSNPAALKMMGCRDKSLLLGLRICDISPERQPGGRLSVKMEKEFATHCLSVGPVRFEWVHRRFNGEEFPVEVVLTPIPVNGKQILHCVWRDITGRKKDEERLRFTQFAVDHARDLIFWVSKKGEFVYVNDAACKALGYSREELLSMTVIDIDPDFTPEGWNRKWNLKKLYGSIVYESRHRAKNGRIYPVEVSSGYLNYGNDEYSCGIVRDITERKGAQDALRESEEKFRQLFEQNEEALIIFQSGTSAIVDANPAALNLYGYEKGILMSRGPSLLFAPPELKRLEELLYRVSNGEASSVENVLSWGKDERSIRINIRGKTIKLKEADVVYCTFRDVSEQIRLEEKAALLHSKLIHANKMASLGVLVSSVAHEVNNPNNFIIFNASLLADAWKDALEILKDYRRENGEFSLGGLPFGEMQGVVARLLQGITEGSRRIKGIVDNLKDYARQDNASLEGRVDINKAVEDSASMLANQIKKHTKSFSLELGQNLPAVKGSFQQLEQVVINLMMNALQALPDKNKGIAITTRFEPERKYVTVRIKDEGIGMSREVMEKITEPFFTTKLSNGGTGLGLSISRSIINDHQGLMEFESEPGKGTRATIRLPMYQSLSERES